MHAGTATAASLTWRATTTTTTTTTSSTSSILRLAPAVRHSSTSAALFRWLLDARGQVAAAAVEVDQTRRCGVQPVKASRSIWTVTREQGRGRIRGRVAAEIEGVLGKFGRETASIVGTGSGTRVEATGGDLVEAEKRKMYTPGYPSHATYSGFESGSANEASSSHPLHCPQRHQHQYQRQYEVRDSPISQEQLQTQTQTQPGMASTAFSAHFAANSSGQCQWPMDPRYNSIAYPGPLPAPSAPVEDEDEMQRRRMRYFGAPAARAAAQPVHGHYGMQVLPPAHSASGPPWAASPAPPSLPSPSPSGPYIHAYPHAPPYHPYAPRYSSAHAHTHTHTRMQPHHPPGGALHFSSSAHQYTSSPSAGIRQVSDAHSHNLSVPPPSPRNVTPSSNPPRPEYNDTHSPRARSLERHKPNPQQGQGPQQSTKPPQEGGKKQQKTKKKAETTTLPPYSFLDRNPRSKVLYVRTAAEADRAVVALRATLQKDPTHNQVVGFDLEWKPKFMKGQPENPVALIQLATRDLIVLAQVSAMASFPEKLKTLLEDSNVFKAGVSIISDSRKLSRDHGVSVHSCIELSFFAKCIDRQKWKGGFQDMIGLSRLVQAYLLNSLPKGSVQTSNWELKLSHTQQKYAANDAHCGLMVFHRLLAMANKMDTDVLPDPSYYSFDVIGQKVLNVNGDAWVPCSPYPEQLSDEESLSDDESPSGPSSFIDGPVHELDSEEEAALLDLIAKSARKLRA